MDILSLMNTIAFLLVPLLEVSLAIDSIHVSQSIRDDGSKTLVSKGEKFELGFFSPGSSNKRYLGIWYKNVPVQTVVWVANRVNPINDSSGILTLNSTGNLVLTQNDTLVWYSTSQRQAHNPVAELLDSGNFVVRNEAEANQPSYMWQSFDYPCDSFLPGMKLGWNFQNGLEWRYTSWKSPNDPSPGEIYLGLVLHNYPELYLMIGTKKFYRYGPWNGLHFSGVPSVIKHSPIYYAEYVSKKNELFFKYGINSSSLFFRYIVSQNFCRGYEWFENAKSWRIYRENPADECENYGLCGAYGNCKISESPVCQCLKGFSPKSPNLSTTTGCVRNKPLSCNEKHDDGFIKLVGMKVPDTTHTWLDETIGLEECRDKCLYNCSCMAYTNSDLRGAGKGCVMWLGDLIDLRQFDQGGQDLYIRMAASELEPETGSNKSLTTVAATKKNKRTIVASTVSAICGILLFCIYLIYRVRRNDSEKSKTEDDIETQVDVLDLPLFDLPTITTTTNNFFIENKIGQGGFGPVYKGILVDGQEIVVKRLSKSSGQGITEFINEVKLIVKLQHRNLVRLLGCCIEGQERLLVYEYMANDAAKGKLLIWPQRLQIIFGIAKGLLYLHQDSRLRIIHRDLKASNVLLDYKLNPKISDFGMAKAFGGDQTEGNTNRVVGTYGYMAPEYAVQGLFSIKSDVYSFGILLMEVISGSRNKAIYHAEDTLNLVGYAWKLWNDGKTLELIDSNIRDSCVPSEVLRCIHVSLLCVQQCPEDRPTMTSVLRMLGREMELVEPQEPGFFPKKVSTGANLLTNRNLMGSNDELTITSLNGR